MDDLAQISPWRSAPRRNEPKPPFRSPLVLNLSPRTKPRAAESGSSFAHRLGTGAKRGLPRILRLL